MIKTHSVDVELAKKVGFDEANVLGFVAYWVRNNRDNGKNFYDGKYWTYNSAEALTNQFPYWTRRQISGIIEKLEKIGAIVKGNYNKNKFDRTSWYTLTDDFMYLIASENEKTNTEMDETNTEI
ncbi:bacteriophage-like protein, partial [Campylobacter showae CC57C]